MNTEDNSDCVLQGIITLSTCNLNYTFFYLCLYGGYNNGFPDLKKCMDEGGFHRGGVSLS